MIFVDTGAWYALASPTDSDHDEAKTFLAASDDPLITTDYIVDELLTLFVVRGQKSNGIAWMRDVLELGGTQLERVTESDFDHALQLYEKYADKDWSLTDCTSYVVMERLKIKQAFSFDHHFRQFGTVTIVP